MSSIATASVSKVKPILGGHETFAFRNGWLKKGIEAAKNNGTIFTKDDALVTLGVGKNMVRAIRHWCLTAGLLEESSGSGLSHPLQATWLGDRLFLEGGWDPFLEREGSLWLMHWQIATNRVRGLVWAITFSEYLETEFTKQSIASFIGKQFEHNSVKTTPDMILRELDCCLHTYITTRASNKQKSKSDGISEDNLDCPLADLDLIRFMPEYDLYHFNVGPKHSLPFEIFGYSLLKFMSNVAQKRSTLALEDCIYQPDSPGQIFKLDENSVAEYLQDLEHYFSGDLRLIETAGLSQIYLSDAIISDLETSSRILLQSYYE
jgi:Protein of unknown function (DUF4007)